MKATKKLTLVRGGTPFQEGASCLPIAFQPAYACAKVLFNISGTIVIGTKTGNIYPQFAAAADGTTLIPYLLPLAGTLTFNGTCNSGKGLKVNGVPIWLLWLENYLENEGNAPVVNDGGMQAANFVAGTYTVSINFNFTFYDPKLPKSQRSMFWYRPSRYGTAQTGSSFTITGGKLFQGFGGGYTSNLDYVALTGDSTTACNLLYTALNTTLLVYADAVQIPSFKQSVGDICFDREYEYAGVQPAIKAATSNGIALNDKGVQMYVIAVATNTSPAGGGASTNLIEQGLSSLFGNSNQGLVDTAKGDTPMTLTTAVNLKADNQDEFMKALSVMPAGVLVFDEYQHNMNEWEQKTWLAQNAPAHIVDLNINPAAGGTNLRVAHITGQPSQPAINFYKNNFPPYQVV